MAVIRPGPNGSGMFLQKQTLKRLQSVESLTCAGLSSSMRFHKTHEVGSPCKIMGERSGISEKLYVSRYRKAMLSGSGNKGSGTLPAAGRPFFCLWTEFVQDPGPKSKPVAGPHLWFPERREPSSRRYIQRYVGYLDDRTRSARSGCARQGRGQGVATVIGLMMSPITQGRSKEIGRPRLSLVITAFLSEQPLRPTWYACRLCQKRNFNLRAHHESGLTAP
jgi:hypothetical protein